MSEGRPDAVARAIDALKRGRPVRVGGVAVLAVETADEAALGALDGGDILVSGHRAATLKLANQRDAVPTAPVRIVRTSWLDLETAKAVADPARDLATPMKGPFATSPVRHPAAAEAALILARLAGLLPALFVGSGEAADSVEPEEIRAAARSEHLRIVSRARLPNRFAEQAEIVAFRSDADGAEHVALLIGRPTGEAPPLVRLHSECLTGDVFGSLKCDCGPQLDDALEAIADSGWGILLYLRQEGRGIGLVNKIRAYQLQDQGFDTVDANHRIGFGDDERDYAVAARMLRALGQERVRLLTNNPMKVAGLEAEGIAVSERMPLKAGENPHNLSYLATKKARSGHQL